MPRPKSISLTPSAADRNGISTTETLLAARLDYLINGALSTGFDRNGIAEAQTPTSAAAMTLDGAVGTDLRFRKGGYVLLHAAADDSARTFTVSGRDIFRNTITEAITGPALGLITLGSTKFYEIISVTPDAATAGDIEVGVNGYAEFSTPQHVQSYHAGADAGDIDTVLGLDRYGNVLSEGVTAVDTGVSTSQALNFARIDRITAAPAPAGATEFGVDGLCESQWFILNYRGNDFNVGLGLDISTGGAMTYEVQHTFDDLLTDGLVEGAPVAFVHDTLTGETTNQDGNYTNPPVATRSAIKAYTSGTLTFNIIQSGSGGA